MPGSVRNKRLLFYNITHKNRIVVKILDLKNLSSSGGSANDFLKF